MDQQVELAKNGELTVKVLGSDIYKAVSNYLNHSNEFKECVKTIAENNIKGPLNKRLDQEIAAMLERCEESLLEEVEKSLEKRINAAIKTEVSNKVNEILSKIGVISGKVDEIMDKVK